MMVEFAETAFPHGFVHVEGLGMVVVLWGHPSNPDIGWVLARKDADTIVVFVDLNSMLIFEKKIDFEQKFDF